MKTILMAVILSSATLVIASQKAWADCSATFPGDSDLSSPNGLYIIKNVEQPTGIGDSDRGHNLIFERKGQKKRSILNPHKRALSIASGAYSYDRSAEIIWSPNSSFFVLNDWMGSNVATVYLYRVSDLLHPIDIEDSFAPLEDKADQRSIVKSDHVYTFANRWLSPTVLEVKRTGHGQGAAFTFYYEFDVQNNSCKFIKRLPVEDTKRDNPALKHGKHHETQ